MTIPPTVENGILLFTEKTERKERKSSRSLGFRTLPLTETHVAQNKALWRAVRAGSLAQGDADVLKVQGVAALVIPRVLFLWLMRYSWQEVSHAVLCILHDATCCAVNWQPHLPCPARLAPSVAKRLRKLRPHNGHCKKGSSKGTPLVTRASMELDDLLQHLAGERLWTVPVRVAKEGTEKRFARTLAPQWRKWKNVNGGGGEVLVRFMDVVFQGGLEQVWSRVEIVKELNMIEESAQSTKERRTLLQQLPEDVMNEHIVPELFRA